MKFTSYGRAMAQAEPHMTYDGPAGASAHAAACAYDVGTQVILTGTDFRGRRFTKTARSVYGAYAVMRAVGGLRRAWHVREDGTRKLLMSR